MSAWPTSFAKSSPDRDRVIVPIEPVELRGNLVAIEPLSAEHAAGLLAAADSEVFSWLPYPRPTDIGSTSYWDFDDPLPSVARA